MQTVTTKRKRGRPAKITLEVIERIGKLMAKGLTAELACLAVEPEVELRSFESACFRNPVFCRSIKKEKARFLAGAVETIQAGGKLEADGKGRQPWVGLAWLLERRHKDMFARVQIDLHGAAPVTDGLVVTPDVQAELSRIAQRVAGTVTVSTPALVVNRNGNGRHVQ